MLQMKHYHKLRKIVM